MTDPKLSDDYVLFRLVSQDRKGRYEFQEARSGKSYGTATFVGGILDRILKDYPIETKIAFQHADSNAISFLPASIRDWLVATANLRGISKAELEAEIASHERVSENLHNKAWS